MPLTLARSQERNDRGIGKHSGREAQVLPEQEPKTVQQDNVLPRWSLRRTTPRGKIFQSWLKP